MNVKKIALLLGALVIAVVTAVMAKNMFVGAGAEQASAAPAVPLGPRLIGEAFRIDDRADRKRLARHQHLGPQRNRGCG